MEPRIPKPEEVSDLNGIHVTLRRTKPNDTPALWDATQGQAAEIFRWYTHPVVSLNQMEEWVSKALNEQRNGTSIAFVTIDKISGKVAGGTRFMTIERENRSVEIGNTWLAPGFQRTALNTEAKYLMMRTAFEDWGCRRVGLKTDSNNIKSRNAILRIGAKEEGTLRNHMVRRDGTARHSVYFSVIEEEWPEVKRALEQKLAR